MNAVVSVLLTRSPDPQPRSADAPPLDKHHPGVLAWHDSLAPAVHRGILDAVVLHDGAGYSDGVGAASWIQVAGDGRVSPYDHRWTELYRWVHRLPEDLYRNVFITDLTDVTMLRHPFDEMFLMDADLFVGDEPVTTGGSKWFRDRVPRHLSLPCFKETVRGDMPLLNPGIVGGRLPVIKDFLTRMLAARAIVEHDRAAGDTDMVYFNWVARTMQRDGVKLAHGTPVNTRFKAFETSGAWFAHK